MAPKGNHFGMKMTLWALWCLSGMLCVIGEDMPSSWLGFEVTEVERSAVHDIISRNGEGERSEWISLSSEIDRLRFLRQQHGDVDKAMESMIKHASWRSPASGADTVVNTYSGHFDDHVLNDEIFWVGPSKDDNCPTLVIRSQLHDGADYNEDAQYFVKYLVYVMEFGRKQWGVGPEQEFCLILDRTDAVKRSSGEVMTDKIDFGCIPKLMELFKVIYGTLHENYPKLLMRAQVLPSSWFFSACWSLMAKVMDPALSSKFEIIRESDIASRLNTQFEPALLPRRFGGLAEEFIPVLTGLRADRSSASGGGGEERSSKDEALANATHHHSGSNSNGNGNGHNSDGFATAASEGFQHEAERQREQEQEQESEGGGGGNHNPQYPHPGGNNNPQQESEDRNSVMRFILNAVEGDGVMS